MATTATGEFLRDVLTARVYDVAVETPLQGAALLSGRVRNRVLLKREDLQPVHSFKVRGAYNKMVHLGAGERARGVVCASAGNHAQGVALAASRLQCPATIVMPTTTPPVKVDAVRAYGDHVQVVLHGDTFADALAHAKGIERDRQLTFVHPYDDPHVIAGQGTIAMEIVRQHPDPIHAVFVAVGGGGMIAGIGTYLKLVRPEVRVVAVQTVDSDSMAQSLQAGQPVALDDVGLFCDGTAVKRVGDETLRLARRCIDEVVYVTTDQVCAAIKDVFLDTRSILEPSGAMSIAGAKAYLQRCDLQGQTVVCVACGANMNFDRLRFVVDRAELGQEREALLVVRLPPGRTLTDLAAVLPAHLNVTECNYNASCVGVFLGVSVVDATQTGALRDLIEANGFPTVDVTGDDLAKNHLRYMVGGGPSDDDAHRTQQVCRVETAQRPGAIRHLLLRVLPGRSITLLHYRNHGGDVARIMIGAPPPHQQQPSLYDTLSAQAGYRVVSDADNAALHILLTRT
ncbi:Threonine dehydratase [Plasmodiophora brassicae]|uniref:Threonine dehydratase n=1 Tax=Plasmodiophora brassicae TaxID=37360 RepID=A0A0G4J1G5_PLABS|nr:hypothetical protein PBRA_008471 [Plasmodiophora brassicae]SPQ99437.1 unnamed protein product [Plasmodiophora brassicae]